MPSEEHREFRSLVKYRKTLDSRICKIKRIIRAWFVNHGISIDTGEKAWHSGRELINSFRKPIADCAANELWKGELDLELTQLDAVTAHMDSVVKRLEAIGKKDPRVQRLKTIPGVGPRTAENRKRLDSDRVRQVCRLLFQTVCEADRWGFEPSRMPFQIVPFEPESGRYRVSSFQNSALATQPGKGFHLQIA